MILKKYIKNYLIENLKIADISIINNIVKILNDECKKTLNNLSVQGKENLFHSYIFNYLDHGNVLYNLGMNKLGEGTFRRVYDIPGQEWVLKLAMSTEAAKINKKEIDVSQGKHGLAARDIFVKVYDYDKLSRYPFWIICNHFNLMLIAMMQLSLMVN